MVEIAIGVAAQYKFCKNCIYYDRWEGIHGGKCHSCDVFFRHPALAIKGLDRVGIEATLPSPQAQDLVKAGLHLGRDCQDHEFQLNAEFDCPFYQRKWWKFWAQKSAELNDGSIYRAIEDIRRRAPAHPEGVVHAED